MDGERNHSMGSPMDGTPSQSETDSDRLMKDNAVIMLTIHYDQKLHAAIIQYIPQHYWYTPDTLTTVIM